MARPSRLCKFMGVNGQLRAGRPRRSACFCLLCVDLESLQVQRSPLSMLAARVLGCSASARPLASLINAASPAARAAAATRAPQPPAARHRRSVAAAVSAAMGSPAPRAQAVLDYW